MGKSSKGFIFVSKDEQNFNGGPWWRPAVQLFSEVSTWIVVPVILALVIGKSLDAHYGTKPLLLLVFVAVAFLVSLYKIVSIVRKYSIKIKK